LLHTVAPRFEEIAAELAALGELRDKPSGNIRITAGEHPALTILAPVLERFLPEYPDVHIEVLIDYGLTDIVTERYDAGVRLGEQVAKDMIAVPIGPEMRMAVVGSPAYFAKHRRPKSPQELTQHRCIGMHMPTYGNVLPWEFERDGRELKVRVEGPLVFNHSGMRMSAVLAGVGLAYMPGDLVQSYVSKGNLIRVLDDWCAPFAGYHLYYPSRRQSSAAFSLFVQALQEGRKSPQASRRRKST
jgi:DNA-binding transcriptional LysR family regulator